MQVERAQHAKTRYSRRRREPRVRTLTGGPSASPHRTAAPSAYYTHQKLVLVPDALRGALVVGSVSRVVVQVPRRYILTPVSAERFRGFGIRVPVLVLLCNCGVRIARVTTYARCANIPACRSHKTDCATIMQGNATLTVFKGRARLFVRQRPHHLRRRINPPVHAQHRAVQALRQTRWTSVPRAGRPGQTAACGTACGAGTCARDQQRSTIVRHMRAEPPSPAAALT